MKQSFNLVSRYCTSLSIPGISSKEQFAPHPKTNLLYQLGNYLAVRGDLAASETAYRSQIALARHIGQRVDEHYGKGNLAVVLSKLGRFEEAERLIDDAISIAKQCGKRAHLSVRIAQKGGILFRKAIACPDGDSKTETLNASIKLHERAVAIAKKSRCRNMETVWLMDLSAANAFAGNNVEAVRCLKLALKLAKQIGFHEVRETIKHNLAAIDGQLAKRNKE